MTTTTRSLLIGTFVAALGVAACYNDTCACSTVPPHGNIVVDLREAGGAPVVATAITITELPTNLIRSQLTDAAGRVIFLELPHGQYSISANIDPGKHQLAPGVVHPRVLTLGPGQTVGIEFILNPVAGP